MLNISYLNECQKQYLVRRILLLLKANKHMTNTRKLILLYICGKEASDKNRFLFTTKRLSIQIFPLSVWGFTKRHKQESTPLKSCSKKISLETKPWALIPFEEGNRNGHFCKGQPVPWLRPLAVGNKWTIADVNNDFEITLIFFETIHWAYNNRVIGICFKPSPLRNRLYVLFLFLFLFVCLLFLRFRMKYLDIKFLNYKQ